MPTLTFTVTYDGTDQEIIGALGRMMGAVNGGAQTSGATGAMHSTAPGWAENVATKFAGFVFEAANRGEPSQKDSMTIWLKHKGDAPLTELVKASHVKKTHDYAGVGSSLSRNMKRAGGPKHWYDKIRDVHGERRYKITPELIQPLKRAFGG